MIDLFYILVKGTNMKVTERELKLLDFLRDNESKQKTFTLKEASEATNYKPNTISKYFTEDLKGRYLFKKNRSTWFSQEINSLSNKEFFALISQSTNLKDKTKDEKFFDKLVERSLDSFTLALEIYNRPSLKNRVEAFSIMIINSWELLLKAQIIEYKSYEEIFYESGKSLSISDALKTVFESECPIKKNLELIIELRDQATHLLIKELQPNLSELFQANVLNYQNQYKSLLGNSPLSGQSVGMLSLIIDGPRPEIAIIKESYGSETADEVKAFLERVNSLKAEYKSNEFAITIDYHLILSKSKNKNKSDIKLTTGDEGLTAKIITVPKSIKKTHKYFRDSARDEINRIQGSELVTNYNFNAVVVKHKIALKEEFYDNTDRKRYSQNFVNWFNENLKQKNWLQSAIEHYKVQLKQNKKPAR